jgi:hypothetical protein
MRGNTLPTGAAKKARNYTGGNSHHHHGLCKRFYRSDADAFGSDFAGSRP